MVFPTEAEIDGLILGPDSGRTESVGRVIDTINHRRWRRAQIESGPLGGDDWPDGPRLAA